MAAKRNLKRRSFGENQADLSHELHGNERKNSQPSATKDTSLLPRSQLASDALDRLEDALVYFRSAAHLSPQHGLQCDYDRGRVHVPSFPVDVEFIEASVAEFVEALAELRC